MSVPATSGSPGVPPELSPIGPYRVVRKLGQGGMGVVYEALHPGLGRRVAIKVLRAELAADKELAARFCREARTVNLIEHPGVVQVVDLGEGAAGEPYIVMEFLRGQTLSDWLKERGGTLPWPDAVNFILQIAEVLQVAHRAGIVHRDLKPENVMLIADSQVAGGQRVKLLDFGIAKVLDEANANHFKTKTGSLMGSPAYMSPEQCRGAEQVTVQADVYALGVVLFELLVGGLPHVADGPGHMVVLHMFGTVRPLRELCRGLPNPLYALVDRMLQKAPDDRPPITTVLSELQQLQKLAGATRRGGRWALGAVLFLLAGIVAISMASKARSGRFPWQPPSVPAQAIVSPPAPVDPVASPTPAAPPGGPGKVEARPQAKPGPARPAANSAPRNATPPPTGDLNFVPVDVARRPPNQPMPMQPVR